MGLIAFGFMSAFGAVGITTWGGSALLANIVFDTGIASFVGGTATLFSNKHMFKYKKLNSNPSPVKKLLILGAAQEKESVTLVRTIGRISILGEGESNSIAHIALELTPDAKERMFAKFADSVRKKCDNPALDLEVIRLEVKQLDDLKVFCTTEDGLKSDNESLREMANEVARKLFEK
ncbi:MAG: hypothetical protein KA715_14560 [Xanthomonadaceae bacterium]|nr:hypothetical protein [Xanthomonadaceae bacterium]